MSVELTLCFALMVVAFIFFFERENKIRSLNEQRIRLYKQLPFFSNERLNVCSAHSLSHFCAVVCLQRSFGSVFFY